MGDGEEEEKKEGSHENVVVVGSVMLYNVVHVHVCIFTSYNIFL